MPRTKKNTEGEGEIVRFPDALFVSFIDALDEPFFIKNDRHQWVFLNDAACRAFNKPRDYLIGKSDYDIFPKEQADVFWARDELVLKTRKTDQNQEEITWKGGTRTVFTKKSLFVMPGTGERYILGTIRDITEHRTAQEELQSKEEQIATLLEFLTDGVCLLDRELRFVLANKEGVALTGLTRRSLIGKPVTDVFSGVKSTHLFKSLNRAMEKGKVVTVAEEFTAKDGSHRWLEISAYPVPDGLLCLWRDITERKKAITSLKVRLSFEKALASCSQALLLGSEVDKTLARVLKILLKASGASRVYIFENSTGPDGGPLTSQICETCTQGVTPQIDNPALNNFPYREGFERWEEELGKGNPVGGLVETFPESEREVLSSQGILSILVLPIFAGQRWYGFIGFDNTESPREWHEDDIRLLKAVSGMIGIYLEHMQTQKTLSFEREQLLSIFDSFNQIVYVADPATYRILYANRHLKDLMGRELVGGFCFKEFQGLDSPCDFCTNEKIRNLDGETYEWEHRNLKVNKDYLLTDRIIRWPDGRDVRLEIGIDITDRKRLETQLRQSQKLEAVGRLAGGVAHDFNNLLTAILGYSDMLALSQELENEARGFVKEIRKSAERAGALTQQLLAFGRRQIMKAEVLDLNTLIGHLEGMLRRLIGENIALTSDLCSKTVTVKADSGQIEQVIVNLVVNARDSMPKGGKILLGTKRVRIDERRHSGNHEIKAGEYALLSVSDTGSGMDEETRARVFEPFFTTKAMGRGTGLGLSIVYGIVKQSGGYIYAQSEVGKGTRFDVYLPSADELAGVKSEFSIPSKPEGGRERILLVEDEDIVRQMISTSLKSYGYGVIEAVNGKEALSLCEKLAEDGRGAKDYGKGAFDILITDVVMPEMGGRELAEKLIRSYPAIKVLYISGYTDDISVRRNVLTRDVPFLQKPFTPAALARKVRELLDDEEENS